jgi:hypothetical protein
MQAKNALNPHWFGPIPDSTLSRPNHHNGIGLVLQVNYCQYKVGKM